MRVDVTPLSVAAPPAQPVVLTVTVANTGDIISGHTLRILGVDPAWVQVAPQDLTLFPGTSGAVAVTITLPAGSPAGRRRIAVQVREDTPPHDVSVVEVDLDIPAGPAVELRVDPVTVTGGASAAYGVVVENKGNTTVHAALAGGDDQDQARFRFAPPRVALGPGEHAVVEMQVKARRRLLGSPVVRPLLVRLDEDRADAAAGLPVDERPRAGCAFVQRPVLSRGAISLVGLLAAVTVFAVVITLALTGVARQSADGRDVALQVAQAGGEGFASGTAGLGGTVRLLTTNAGLAGVTVELFDQSDPATALATAATAASGAYSFKNLPEGGYKLRFRGAGFAEIWYPGTLTDADATEVPLKAGEARKGIDVRLGGLPATITGKVFGDGLTGATAVLTLPPEAAPTAAGTGAAQPQAPAPATVTGGAVVPAGAVLRTVEVGDGGSFVLADVPSPAVYDLVVSAPGFATETQRIDVDGGENREGLVVRLRKGDGEIAGFVNGPDGPIGGATIVATYGTTTTRTASVTEGDVGAFTVRDLPTPTTVTLQVSMPSFATETLSLSLVPGQRLAGIGVTLGGNSGSLSGRVSALGIGPPGEPGAPKPAGGVTVTVSDGDLTIATVSGSNARRRGAWRVEGLPVPGSYTVTFSRTDLEAQTVSVRLDKFGGVNGSPALTDVDATLRPATAVLRGRTLQIEGTTGPSTPVGETSIVVTTASTRYEVTSAAKPWRGAYELTGLPPGTYTVTASRPGTRPTSQIVTLTAGVALRLDLVLIAPASIEGTARQGERTLAAVEVRLYRSSDYPNLLYASTRTDADGRYRFSAVEAPENYVVELVFPAGTPAASETIPLQASENLTGVDLRVPVRDEAGRP
jgi:5-hydroxyisourate hydrolase-like protein (transthyretin family)